MKILKITVCSIVLLLLFFDARRTCNADPCANEAAGYKNDKFYLKIEKMYRPLDRRGLTFEGHDNKGEFCKYEESNIWLRDSELVLGDSIKKDSGIVCFYLK